MNRFGSGLLAGVLVLGSLSSVAAAASSVEGRAADPAQSTWTQLLRQLGTARGAERDAINAEIRSLEIRWAKAYIARQRLLPFGAGGNVSSYGGGR
jgi:hypothetical protein